MGVISVDLGERKLQILQAIIEDYITTGEPVGSRTIAKKYGIGISPATIRNEMSDLEEMGYLEQPHTSAGRIPSDKGYRLYVDRLLKAERLSISEANYIKDIYDNKTRHIEQIIFQTSKICLLYTSCRPVDRRAVSPFRDRGSRRLATGKAPRGNNPEACPAGCPAAGHPWPSARRTGGRGESRLSPYPSGA